MLKILTLSASGSEKQSKIGEEEDTGDTVSNTSKILSYVTKARSNDIDLEVSIIIPFPRLAAYAPGKSTKMYALMRTRKRTIGNSYLSYGYRLNAKPDCLTCDRSRLASASSGKLKFNKI